MVPERFDPIVDSDAMAYYEAGVDTVDRNHRMYFVLKHVFNGLAMDFNDEIRHFVHTKYNGNFDAMFESISPEGEAPELRPVDHNYRTFITVGNEIYNIRGSQFEECYMSTQRRIEVAEKGVGTTHIFSPVGEYGPELSIAIVQAARSTYSLVGLIGEKCDEVNEQYREILKKGTFFEDAHIIMREAAGTIAAVFSLAVTKQKTPNYEDDPVGLFKQCIDDNVFVTTATISPFGLIVPMANHDLGFPTGLESNEEGHVSLSNETQAFLLEERRVRGFGKGSDKRTFGCPATPDGIRYVGEIFHKALRYHYNHPTVFPQNPSQSI